jgi:hypothetical protein
MVLAPRGWARVPATRTTSCRRRSCRRSPLDRLRDPDRFGGWLAGIVANASHER